MKRTVEEIRHNHRQGYKQGRDAIDDLLDEIDRLNKLIDDYQREEFFKAKERLD